MQTQNKIITLSLASLMLFNALYVSLTYAYYYLDQSDFIAQFCENIDKPALQCNGKCHLEKVVKENLPTDTVPTEKITFKQITLFVVKAEKVNLSNFITKKQQILKYTNLYTYTGAYEFYHPPRA